jgi:hypothetical protein
MPRIVTIVLLSAAILIVVMFVLSPRLRSINPGEMPNYAGEP